jgi:hypothetical protein
LLFCLLFFCFFVCFFLFLFFIVFFAFFKMAKSLFFCFILKKCALQN